MVWLPVVACVAFVSRRFFIAADSAVFLSGDDALGNISYALATEGRYGFLTSPVLANMPRDQGLFSYGPFYFYLGAALTWLFGYSLVLLRTIHLGVILAIAAAGGVWFRRAWGVGPLLAMGLLMAFERAQWPMVRPDSLVSLFAIALVISAGMAIRAGRAGYWFAAGLAASCGALTHLVAWALVPGSAVMLGVGYLADSKDENGRWRRPTAVWLPLAALVGGGLVGAALFYASFGFRIQDQIAFLSDYQRFTASVSQMPAASFRELIGRHFEFAFWFLPYPVGYLVWATMVAAAGLVIVVLARGRSASRPAVLAILAPPVITWVAYLLSLGRYDNFHQGYAILNHVMWLWTSAALLSALLHLLNPWPLWHRASSIAMGGGALAVGVFALIVFGRPINDRVLAAESMTPISAYVENVLETLPARARAWGTAEFGIEHPSRIQLIQFWDAIRIVEALPADRRAGLSPDYLVWGRIENDVNTRAVMGVGGTQTAVDTDAALLVGSRRLVDFFPDTRYTLVAMTAGPPYGVTRVYARSAGAPPTDRPMVRVYDPTLRQWRSVLGAPVQVPVSPAAVAEVRSGTAPARAAVQTLRGELAPGSYLLKVRLATLPASEAAIVLASPSLAIPWDRQMGATVGDVSPWFAGEAAAYVIYQHTGGPFYVSEFGPATPGIVDVEASLIWPLTNYTALRRAVPPEHPVPAQGWTAASTEQSVKVDESGVAVVLGNSLLFGYQAMGPRLSVQPGQRVRMRVPVTVTAGKGCLGILDEGLQRWLVAPDRLLPEYELTVDAGRTITPVLADCSASAATVTPLRATIGNGTYAVWSEQRELYVDELMREYRKVLPRR